MLSQSLQSDELEKLIAAFNSKPEDERKVIYEKITDYYQYLDANSLYPFAMTLCNVGHGPSSGVDDDTLRLWESNPSMVPDSAYLEVNVTGDLQELDPWVAFRYDTRPQSRRTGPAQRSHQRTRWASTNRTQVLSGVDFKMVVDGHPERVHSIKRAVHWEKEAPLYQKVMDKLYTARLNAKQEGNKALSAAMKLIMNSGYGETLMQTRGSQETRLCANMLETRDFMVNHDDWDLFETDGDALLMSGSKKLDRSGDDGLSRSIPQVGGLVLSNSHKVMRDLYNVAHPDHNSGSFESVKNQSIYTDTDSMLVHARSFPLLQAAGVVGMELGKLKDELSEHTFMDGRPGKIISYCSPVAKTNALLYIDGEDYIMKHQFRCKAVPHATPISIDDDFWDVHRVHPRLSWAAIHDLYWMHRKQKRGVDVTLHHRIRRQVKGDVVRQDGKKIKPFSVYEKSIKSCLLKTANNGRDVLPWVDPEHRLFDLSVPFGWVGERVPAGEEQKEDGIVMMDD